MSNFWETAGEWWLGQAAKYDRSGVHKDSEKYIDDNVKGFTNVLEIGAGNGRLIGRIEAKEKHSVDICKELCKEVKRKFPDVKTHNTPATDLSCFKDNTFDLVYTYQCLQHIKNAEIIQVLREMLRVSKNEIWLIEGWKDGYAQGQKSFKGLGNSYVYYFNQWFKCYKIDLLGDGRVRAYRIRKADQDVQSSMCR